MEAGLSNIETKILGNFNVLLLRRRIMASDNAVGSRLPLLLVMLMILPSILTIASSPDEPIELSGDRISNESMGFLH